MKKITRQKPRSQDQKQPETSSAKVKGQSGRVISVGLKLFLIIFLSILSSVVVTGLVSLSVSEGMVESNSEQSALETIQQTSAKLDTLLLVYEQTVMQLLTSINLHEWLFVASDANRQIFDQLTAQKEISEMLNQVAYSNSNISNISLIPVHPDLPFYTTFSSRNVEIDRETDWFKEVTSHQQPVWLHTRPGGYTQFQSRAQLAVARMMKTNYAQQYVILVEIYPTMLNEQVKGIQLSDTSIVHIVDADNRLLHGNSEDEILKESDLPIPEGGAGKVTGADGEEYLVVSHYSDKGRWYVVGAAPISELTEDIGIIRRVVQSVIIGAAIVAVLLSLLVTRTMGTPLRKLSTLMMEGAKGNLNVRINIRNRDEIGQVGRSFNEMMEQIKGLVQQTSQSAADVLNTAQELSMSAQETAQAAREISEATEQIAGGASTLAAEAERGNELVGNLSKQLSHVVDANRTMGEVASDVHQVSEQGTGYMAQLNEKTQRTEEMTRRMVERVDRLKESTASIRSLLDMLTRITQQTNILALNASIEASRSGTAGRGFMVIAGEIRKLADQSRESIGVVAEMTDQIQGGIDEMVRVMTEAYPLFQEQIEAVKDAEVIFNRVRERMTGLVQQADKVTDAIEQLEKAQLVLSDTMSSVSAVSEESSAISEEVASSSMTQLNTSESLVKLVNKLEALSGELTESLKKFKI